MNKYLLLLLLACCFTSKTLSQVSLTGYSTFAVGAESKIYKKFSGEFRMYTNDILDNTNVELQFYLTLKQSTFHQIKLGAGVNGNVLAGEINSIQIPFQLHIFPLKDTKKMSIILELAPQWFGFDAIETYNVVLRQLWGIRYTFGGAKE
ncbi:MAG: hypothetical protein IPO92_10090 [Saprospiraceae bacterium]|nr:hypothetical protein [Saprospiraceae bacterium]